MKWYSDIVSLGAAPWLPFPLDQSSRANGSSGPQRR